MIVPDGLGCYDRGRRDSTIMGFFFSARRWVSLVRCWMWGVLCALGWKGDVMGSGMFDGGMIVPGKEDMQVYR